MSFKALFYAEQDYAFDILRPLQAHITSQGGSVHWLLVGNDISPGRLLASELSLQNVSQAIRLQPEAVFVPGDRVPSFIPGLKVQVFHGLNEDKRGNVYPERGLFDLYCTEGPGRTAMLKGAISGRHTFNVCETGWLKLDTLFNYSNSEAGLGAAESARPTILFASTFTPRLSCAATLVTTIQTLSQKGDWQWLVTLHPKMSSSIVSQYQQLVGPNLQFCTNDQVIDAMHRADVMVCDNSSILQEFLLLKKPVVTVNNRSPGAHLINIVDPSELQSAIERALQPHLDLQLAIDSYGASITPYLDGQSAARVYQAAIDMLESGWQDRKPANLFRNLKMRGQLKYFKFW